MAVCAGTKRDGEPCTANSMPGSRWCYHHHPGLVEKRPASASQAATAKHSSVARELRDIRELILELLRVLLSDQLPVRVRKELQSVVQLLQCYLRAAELGMRAAEEPLRSDLDVAGLKAQMLGRIEELEAREREREELLSELVPAMKARGYEAGAVKAMMSD